MNYASTIMNSPVGELTLIATDRGLAAILWEHDDPDRVRFNNVPENRAHPVLIQVQQQLNEYFAGDRKSFSIELDATGTEFQKKVWKALSAIPYGETRSYGELAKQIGNPKASRAVGAANRRNPISIIVPCHRCIGASGALTGFAGGLKIKAQLLDLEKGAD